MASDSSALLRLSIQQVFTYPLVCVPLGPLTGIQDLVSLALTNFIPIPPHSSLREVPNRIGSWRTTVHVQEAPPLSLTRSRHFVR